ncbi:DUF6484 domain-containing protein [Ketobacter sp.]|uniref:DUF6484 domain-containing protein n=1 Tax=Ketobacter sp. TaxID=2083498 RepID=UPI000F1E5DAD|nr:DUF6484 domain-containing protein [Ketobacter sp.]RLU00314.1 MAG: hypothetical protein D9N14_07435 [Ketobacter sp.]
MGAQQDIDQDSSSNIQLPECRRDFGIHTATLIGFKDGSTPLISLSQPPTASVPHPTPTCTALAARSIVELHGDHIGSEVVIQYENGEPGKPMIMGVVRTPAAWPATERPAQVTVEADDERLTVDAKQQIVLRCGKASITLTQAGKVLIKGTYISSRSSGANRIKGGSILLN